MESYIYYNAVDFTYITFSTITLNFHIYVIKSFPYQIIKPEDN